MELFAKLFGSLLVFVYHCFDRVVIHGYLSGLSRRLALPIIVGTAKFPGIKIHDTRMICLMEVLLHAGTKVAGWRAKQLCGPLANSLFHHQRHPSAPNTKLESAIEKADLVSSD